MLTCGATQPCVARPSWLAAGVLAPHLAAQGLSLAHKLAGDACGVGRWQLDTVHFAGGQSITRGVQVGFENLQAAALERRC